MRLIRDGTKVNCEYSGTHLNHGGWLGLSEWLLPDVNYVCSENRTAGKEYYGGIVIVLLSAVSY